LQLAEESTYAPKVKTTMSVRYWELEGAEKSELVTSVEALTLENGGY